MELVLYIGVSTLVLGLLSFSIMYFVNSRIKTQALTTVNQDLVRVLETVTQYVRDSDGVTTPTPGNTSGSLELVMTDAGQDPTIISVSDDAVWITEGANDPVRLTTTSVTIDGLNFYNVARVDTPDIINVTATFSHINPDGRQEYDAHATATTSVSTLEYD